MGFRAVLATLLLASSLSSSATASHAQAQPRLGAHNTITGARDGTVDVVLPRDVTLPLKLETRSEAGPAPWITFEGGGRVTGIVLMPTTSNDAISSGLVAIQFRACKRRCSERPVNALMVNGSVFHGHETLPKGDYRLYVFGDGSPVKVKLQLADLTGVTEVSVGPSVDVDVATPEASVQQHDDVTIHWAAASYAMKSHSGLFMAVNVMRDENYRSEWFDECLSSDQDLPDNIERWQCAPMGGFTFFQGPSVVRMLQPRKGGFIVITFVGLDDSLDNVFNGNSALQHYVFRVFSPGSMGELWSQGALLSL